MAETANQDNILTEVEFTVLKLIAKGYTNKGISKILNVSLFTVKNHRQTIMKKFQAKNCTEAIYKAVKMDLI